MKNGPDGERVETTALLTVKLMKHRDRYLLLPYTLCPKVFRLDVGATNGFGGAWGPVVRVHGFHTASLEQHFSVQIKFLPLIGLRHIKT